jgi:uncharacterized protein (DUF2235 family)
MADIRNLVVLFDGTWNTPQQIDDEREAPTNVSKLSNALASLNGQQRQHYEEGVGTGFEESLPGGILGSGIRERLLKGYSFLQEMYSDGEFGREDNKVFIFGFSRGAYTARLLCHLINWSGIPGQPADCEAGLAAFLDGKKAAKLKKSGRFFDIPVEMVGVWDTVKSAPIKDHKDAVLPKAVLSGYHAMALDEKRRFFPVLRWKKNDPRVRELWFAGVHCDVGGGYARTGLSDTALRWMIDQARTHGLKFKVSEIDKIKPDPLAAQHDSFKGWELLGKKRRQVMDPDLIHESVKQKIAAGYSPDVTRWPEDPHYST